MNDKTTPAPGDAKNLVPVKKLPALFRKKYAEKKFAKKILARLYIPADKEFVQSLFSPSAEGKLALPPDSRFSKADFLRLKRLAKQIKKQKGRVRLVPFAAVAALIAGAVIVVGLFKNPIAKRLLKAGIESVAGAQCDIGSVSVKFLDASLEIRSLAVANKNDTMKNLFQMDRIAADFDLKQLLRGRFVVDELDASGIQIGTERKTDGALPESRKKQKEESKPNPVVESIKSFSAGAKGRAEESVMGIFASYNPETILQGLFDHLKLPGIADEARTQIEALIPAWKDTPAELTASVNGIIKRGESLAKLDVNALKSEPAKIPQAVTEVTTLINEVKAFEQQTKGVITRIDADARSVADLSKRVQSAFNADMSLVNGEIAKIRSFTIDDGKDILTNAFDTVIAAALGTYYPYLVRGLELAREYSTRDKRAEKEAKKEAERTRRLSGRTIEYRIDNIPKFLVKKMHSSGSTGAFSLDAQAADISSDMEKWGRPSSLQVLSTHGAMAESVLAQLDVRENRPNPFFSADFSGSGYGVNLRIPDAEKLQGVPSLTGITSVTAKCRFDTEELFSIESSVNINPAVIKATAFEPEFAYKIYSNILSEINTVNAGVLTEYGAEKGFALKVTSNLDKTLKSALQKEVNAQLSALKDSAIERARIELDKATGGLSSRFDEFFNIQGLIKGEDVRLTDFQKTLESKLTELQNSAKAQAQTQLEEKVKEVVPEAATNLLQNLLPKR
jgi:uncharacterized protein (TIGR03545 family)